MKQAENSTAPPVVLPAPTLDLSWGGPGYNSYSGFLNTPAATPAATTTTPSGGTPGSPTPAAGSGPSPASGSSAAPPAAGAPPASPAGGGKLDWSTAPAQLRSAYEQAAATLEKYTAIGDPDEVASQVAHVREIITKSTEVGTRLGYSNEQVAAAVKKYGPVATHNFLMRKAEEAAAQGGGEGEGGEGDLDARLEQRLRPVQDYIAKQQASAANARFTTEFNNLVAKDYPADKALPEPVSRFLYNMTSEIFKYDKDAMGRLHEGKVSDVQKHYDKAKGLFMTVYNAMKAHDEKSSPAGGPPPPSTKPGERPSLNDIIEGNDKAKAHISSFR